MIRSSQLGVVVAGSSPAYSYSSTFHTIIMYKRIELPSLAELQRVFVYNPTTGELKRKRSGKAIKPAIGARYIQARWDSKDRFLVHRIAWKLMTGQEPPVYPYVIDHVNDDGHDNRWSNLQLLSNPQNIRKGKRGKGYWLRNGKYRAEFKYLGVKHYLGTFGLEADAVAVVNEWRTKLGVDKAV